MQLHIYNTLSRKKEIFIPANPEKVTMYVCGPTVYDTPHIGNARSIVVYDLLFRVLKLLFSSEKVVYVRNITDVDDKIIEKAKEQQASIHQVTSTTIKSFHELTKYLKCLDPNIEPKATDNVQVMIKLIQELLNRKHAYISKNHVYFSVQSDPNYNSLANRELDKAIPFNRVEDTLGKKFFADFVLWKPATEAEDIAASFDSPWGKGRPGWHIECSAMSYRFLGKNFDIHGGGADLIFPHHTNEIAQSCCAFPGSTYAQYWVHNGFLTVRGAKMSKSLGNFITVQNLKDQNVDGEAVRLMLLNTHYRKPLDFTDKALNDAKLILDNLYSSLKDSDAKNDNLPEDFWQTDYVRPFFQAILDDLNTHKAISYLLQLAQRIQRATDLSLKKELEKALLYLGNFIGILNNSFEKKTVVNIEESEILVRIEQRAKAKAEKNWGLADNIREELMKSGIQLLDHSNGTTSWSIKK